jgi:hypothetical protein
LWWHQRWHLIRQGKVSSCHVRDCLGMGRSAVAISENEAFWIFFHLFIVEFIQIVLA